jgi:MFS family permease
MQILNKLLELPKENWMLFFAIIINRLGNMAFIFLILYLHDRLGFSVGIAGIISCLYGVGALFSGVIGGLFIDRYGAFRVMVVSLSCAGIVMLLYPLMENLACIMLLTLLWGFFGEIFRPASQVAVVHFCSIDQRKIAFALNRLAINLGMSIAPMIGGFLASHYFKAIFVFNGISQFLTAIFLFYLFKRHMKFSENPLVRSSAIYSLKTVLTDARLLYPMLAFMLTAVVFFQTDSVYPLFLVKNLGLLLSTVGIIFAINTVIIIFCEIPINVLTADWPHNITLSIGAVFSALGFGMYAFVHTIPFGIEDAKLDAIN